MSKATDEHIVVIAAFYGSREPGGPMQWVWVDRNTNITGWATEVHDEAVGKTEQ